VAAIEVESRAAVRPSRRRRAASASGSSSTACNSRLALSTVIGAVGG
jgi:hypothetical protein